MSEDRKNPERWACILWGIVVILSGFVLLKRDSFNVATSGANGPAFPLLLLGLSGFLKSCWRACRLN